MIDVRFSSHYPHQENQQEQRQEEKKSSPSTYLNETPSHEPFNIDPDVDSILSTNQEIIKNSEPQFVIDPRNYKDNELNDSVIQRSLIHIITKRELYKLGRFEQSERLYFQEFNKIMKRKYNSSCQYLIQRLNFNNSRIALDPITNLPITHFTCPIGDYRNQHQEFNQEQMNRNSWLNSSDPSSQFKTSPGLIDGLDFRVIRNEWPYAIPKEYQHMIVWSRLPLIDANSATSPKELEEVKMLGLSGIENKTAELIAQLNRFNLNDDSDQDDFDETNRKDTTSIPAVKSNDSQLAQPSSVTTQSLSHHKSRPLEYQIRKFVRYRWPVSQGFRDIFWFLNPAYLQSCPELPHFHVFVNKI